MTIEHKDITDAYLHEPKGVAAAVVNKVYVSDGAGSGTWQKVAIAQMDSAAATVNQLLTANGSGGVTYTTAPHGRVSFNNVSVPYTLTYPSTYTKIAATTTASGMAVSFTEGTTSRLTYTGTATSHAHIAVTLSVSQAVGANRDLRFKLYHNGVAVNSTEVIMTTASAIKVSTAMHADVELATNDYIEVYAQNDGGSGDIIIYGLYIFALGMR